MLSYVSQHQYVLSIVLKFEEFFSLDALQKKFLQKMIVPLLTLQKKKHSSNERILAYITNNINIVGLV